MLSVVYKKWMHNIILNSIQLYGGISLTYWWYPVFAAYCLLFQNEIDWY